MTRARVRGKALALWIGLPVAVVGLILSMLLGSSAEPDPEPQPRSGHSMRGATTAPSPPSTSPRLAVVWGVEDARGAARRLVRSESVRSATVIRRGATLLKSTRRSDGRIVQTARPGFAIPLDVVSIDPRPYAATLPSPERPLVRRLRRGEALVSRTSARLRRVDTGGTFRLAGGRRLRVAGLLPDAFAQYAEVLVTDSERMPSARDSVLAVLRDDADPTTAGLVRTAGGDARARTLDTASVALPPRGPARQAELKARFGEPAVTLPYGDDWVRLDPAFLREHIVTRPVPILGAVTCHSKMLPALRAAMTEIDRRQLGRFVDPGDYAGCYAPRRIRPGGSLSLHAWGLAVDLNASANPHGGRSSQDPRLVRVMERHGFTWGGSFPRMPDPMHFEFRGR